MKTTISDRPSGLTAKQSRFVDEYLIDLDATKAAIRAGYSAKSASQLGWQLLQKPAVQEAVEAARADLAERTKLTQELIIRKLIANVEAAAADKSFSAVNRDCEILGRHLGMWTLEDDADKRKLDDHVPLEDRLAGYLREETIDAAENVERLPARTSGDGNGNGADEAG